MAKKKLSGLHLQLAIQYSEQLRDPTTWTRTAEQLVKVANSLEAKIQDWWRKLPDSDASSDIVGLGAVLGVHFLLVAFAAENYLKAAIVRRNVDIWRSRLFESLPRELRSHDLLQLAKKSGFPVDQDAADLFERLERNSVWSARYPVPAKSDDTHTVSIGAGGRPYFTALFRSSDVEETRQLLENIRQHAEDSNPQP